MIEECDDVLVPMLPEPLCYDPTARTIDSLIRPYGKPFRVVINGWDPRDGDTDLRQTAEYVRRMGWPLCNTVVRRYKIHTRASAEGMVVTQYPKNRVALEASQDFLRPPFELGYGGRPRCPELGRPLWPGQIEMTALSRVAAPRRRGGKIDCPPSPIRPPLEGAPRLQ